MYCDVTRRLELLRPVTLDVFNQHESCPSNCNGILTKSKDIRSKSSSKKPIVRRVHGALEKKYFFSGEVCPLYFSEKYGSSKKQAYSPQGEVCPLSPRAW